MPAKAKKPKSPFEKARSVEESYARDLRRIAREVGRIIDSFPPGDPAVMPRLMEALRKYAEVLRPWAESRAETMIKALDRQDDTAWRKATQAMSQGLRDEVRSAPTGFAMRALLGEQVELITSLPIKAAERVHRLAQEAIVSGSRSKDFIEEIMRSRGFLVRCNGAIVLIAGEYVSALVARRQRLHRRRHLQQWPMQRRTWLQRQRPMLTRRAKHGLRLQTRLRRRWLHLHRQQRMLS